MNCKEALEWLSARQDGELEPEQEKLLEEHLQTCESCREIADFYKNLDGELAMLEQPPAELVSGVMARIAQEKPKKKRWYFGSATAVAAAAALLLVFGGTYLPQAPKAPTEDVAMVAEEPVAPRAVEAPTEFMAASMPNTLVITDDATHPVADSDLIQGDWAVQPQGEYVIYQIDMKTAKEVVETWGETYEMELIAPEDAPEDSLCYLEILPN